MPLYNHLKGVFFDQMKKHLEDKYGKRYPPQVLGEINQIEISRRSSSHDDLYEKHDRNSFHFNSSNKSTRSKNIFHRSQSQLNSSMLNSSAPSLLSVSSSTLRFKKQSHKDSQTNPNRKSKEESRTQWYSMVNNESENDEHDVNPKSSLRTDHLDLPHDPLVIQRSRTSKSKSACQLRLSPNINSLNLSLSSLSSSYPGQTQLSTNESADHKIQESDDSKPPPLPAKHSSLDYMALVNLDTRTECGYEGNFTRSRKNSLPITSIVRKKPLPPPPSPRYSRKSAPNSNGTVNDEPPELPKKPSRCTCSPNVPNVTVPTSSQKNIT